MLFNQQLASITQAGIPLERGLRELADDVGSRSMRKLINAIADELEAGVSIEEAFEKKTKAFPSFVWTHPKGRRGNGKIERDADKSEQASGNGQSNEEDNF